MEYQRPLNPKQFKLWCSEEITRHKEYLDDQELFKFAKVTERMKMVLICSRSGREICKLINFAIL